MPSPQANDKPWQLHPGFHTRPCSTPSHHHNTMILFRGRVILAFGRIVPKKVGAHLVAFVAGECLKVKPSERLLGSSEVMESVFGKVKRLEQDQAKSGLTGLILSVAAMVSTTTTEVIQKALATVSTKQVLAWCKKTLGPP